MKSNHFKYLISFVIGLVILLNLVFLSFYVREIYSLSLVKRNSDACGPYNLEYKKMDSNEVYIRWKTQGECVGLVKYGEVRNSLDTVVTETNGLNKVKDHEVGLKLKETSFPIYFVISSDQQDYGLNEGPMLIN